MAQARIYCSLRVRTHRWKAIATDDLNRGISSVCLCRTGSVQLFFKQKTAYEIMSGDWSSDVCSSD
eukprot:COSAG02_NODE_24125_length_697_cov_0.964883_2_plen_65_part_01